MKTKSDTYKKEQINLSNKIIEILELDTDNQVTLYHLDRDRQKTDRIMELLPELRKYFAFRNMCGIENPEKLNRPWLSIIKHVTKITHVMDVKYKMLTIDKIHIKTRIYTFVKKF